MAVTLAVLVLAVWSYGVIMLVKSSPALLLVGLSVLVTMVIASVLANDH